MKAILLLLATTFLAGSTVAQIKEEVGISPWGDNDEMGTLNMMTAAPRAEIFGSINSSAVYDLSAEYFVGMPSFHAFGDPGYQYWLTHTPHGTEVDNTNGLGATMNQKVSYTGDAISMYTHMGTHIDALNHFGLDGKIWNGFSPEENLGDKGWKRTGAKTIPPITARGVLIDVATYKGAQVLQKNYRVNAQDLKEAIKKQGIEIRKGDVVLITTGQAQYYQDTNKYLDPYPGINLEAVKLLIEDREVMLLGADNLSLEAFPSERADNWVPVHTYPLAQKGVMFIEQMDLENLAKDQIYEFAFIATPLKFRVASAAPMLPIAIPILKFNQK